MKEQCLWLKTSPEAQDDFEALEGDLSCDVCVIGGGITGLSTALHLAESGVDVALLDAGAIPNGGSSANVGLVNAGLWLPPDDIVDVLGGEDGHRVNSILGQAPAEVFRLIDKYAICCDDTRTGTLHMAHNDRGLKELERRHAQFIRQGAPVELLQGAAAKSATGSEKIHGVLLDRRAGTINPAAYARGLARAAYAAGARIFTHAPAQGLVRASGRWVVSASQGSIHCEHVVLATNAYTEHDWNAVKSQFFTGYYYQVASHPLEGEAQEEVLPGGQGAWDTRKVLSSIRRDTAGRLVLGSLGRGEGKPSAFLTTWARRIQRHYFSELGDIKWECTWTGKMAFTPDHMLRLFSPSPGVYAVSGYNGRGVTTGTIVGKGFAEKILRQTEEGLPLPLRHYEKVGGKKLRSFGYEFGFTLYHAGQCMRILN